MEKIDLSYELSFICGDNVNCSKIVQHPIPTCENREGTLWQFSK